MNNMDDLFKNIEILEPRELFPFEEDEGALLQSIEKYVQNKVHKYNLKKNRLSIKCTFVKREEEEFFNDVLFKLIFDSEHLFDDRIYLNLEDVSKSYDISKEKIMEVLFGLTMINIKIEDEKEFLFMSTSNLFTGLESDENDSGELCCLLYLEPEFLRACSEVKVGMDKNG